MESLLLFCRALSSPTMCRFIPALSVTCFPSEPPHRSKVACSIEAFAVIGQVTVRPDQPENALSVTCPWSFGKTGQVTAKRFLQDVVMPQAALN